MSAPTESVDIQTLLSHSSWVRSLARSLVYDESTAEDLVQETWLAALRSPPRDGKFLQGWLAKVVRNLAANQYRSRSRRQAREERYANQNEVLGTDDPIERAELQRFLINKAWSLPEIYRDVLILRYFDELTFSQIAERLKISLATAKKRAQRGLEELREQCKATYGPEWKALATWLFQLESLQLSATSGAAMAFVSIVLKIALPAFLLVGIGVSISTQAFQDSTGARISVDAVQDSPDEPFVHADQIDKQAAELTNHGRRKLDQAPMGWAGQVLTIDGVPIEDLSIQATNGRDSCSIQTSSTGRFRLAWPSEWEWNENARLEIKPGQEFYSKQEFTTQPSSPFAQVNLEGEASFRVPLRFVSRSGKQPVARISVRFEETGDFVDTGEDGRVTLFATKTGFNPLEFNADGPALCPVLSFVDVNPLEQRERTFLVSPYPRKIEVLALDAETNLRLPEASFFRSKPWLPRAHPENEVHELASEDGALSLDIPESALPISILVEAPGYFGIEVFTVAGCPKPLTVKLVPIVGTPFRLLNHGKPLAEPASVSWWYRVPKAVVPRPNGPFWQGGKGLSFKSARIIEGETAVQDGGMFEIPLPLTSLEKIPLAGSRSWDFGLAIQAASGISKTFTFHNSALILKSPPLTLDLNPPNVMVTVHVQQRNGLPCPNAEVEVRLESTRDSKDLTLAYEIPNSLLSSEASWDDEQKLARGKTDEFGNCRFELSAPSVLAWKVSWMGQEKSAGGFPNAMSDGRRLALNTKEEKIQVIFDQAALSISGTIVTPNGSAIPRNINFLLWDSEQASIRLRDEEKKLEPIYTKIHYDSLGNATFEFRQVPAGASYQVDFTDSDLDAPVTALAGQRDVKLLLPPLQTVQFEVLDAHTRKTMPDFEVLLANESGIPHMAASHVFKLHNSIRIFKHALIKKDGYQYREVDLMASFPLDGSRIIQPRFELFPGRNITFVFTNRAGLPWKDSLRVRWENPSVDRIWYSQLDAWQEPSSEGRREPMVEIIYSNGSYESMSFQAYEGEDPGTPVGPRIWIPAGQADVRREVQLE